MNRRWEAETDRVRRRTSPEILEKLERELERNVRFYGGRSEAEITQRIAELENEWSIERYLNTNASALALTGAVLGLTVSRKWLLLSAVVGGFLLKHAVSGWCPPVPLLRRLGVRTRGELDREKFALKAIRGDFKNLNLPERSAKNRAPVQAIEAVSA
jgi:Protein of unknown function (DUF2892).